VKSLEGGNTKVYLVPKSLLYINMGEIGQKKTDAR